MQSKWHPCTFKNNLADCPSGLQASIFFLVMYSFSRWKNEKNYPVNCHVKTMLASNVYYFFLRCAWFAVIASFLSFSWCFLNSREPLSLFFFSVSFFAIINRIFPPTFGLSEMLIINQSICYEFFNI